MSQSSRWKLQGGMNRRPNNNIITNNTSHSNILNTRTFGTVNTTIEKKADLRDIQEASIYNFDQNAINYNNVISYYPFNNLSYNTLPGETTNSDISNQSLATNLKTPKPFSLEFKTPLSITGTLHRPNVAYNDLISQNVIQLDPSSQVLATALHFNKDNAFKSTSNTDITTALTMSCFVYIQDSDVSPTAGDSKQFCLFAMDDLSQNALQKFTSSPVVDGSDNLLYLWYPNKNGKAQLLYGYKSENAAQSWSYINKQSTEQIPTNKWTQVILVLAGTSIYVIVDGKVVITSSGIELQGASYVPDQPFNINLGPYYYDYDTDVSANLLTTNTARPLLSDCKLANWAVSPELAAALASPRGYGHQYSVEEEPNKEGLLYYLLSKELISFSTPTLFRSDLNLGGDLQSYGTNNLYGKNNFYTKVYFADGFIADASSTIVYQGETGNIIIDSSTPVTTGKNSSLIINNSSETGGNGFMASMLVYNYVTGIDTKPKPNLPSYVSDLQFSISGENVSVGHGFGDSSFNVFGNSVMDGNLSFTNGYIGISQDTTTGPIRIGNDAGETNQGDYSVAMGYYAGNNTQGDYSVAMGFEAGQTTQGIQSVAIGSYAGQADQKNNSVAIGTLSGNSSQGIQSVALGYFAGNYTQGEYSIAIGNAAGQTSQGDYSVALGINAGNSSQGINSVAMGNAAGQNTQGEYSVAIGSGAGNTEQSGNSVAIGFQAGNQTQGDSSVAIGFSAGSNNQGSESVAIGFSAGVSGQGEHSVAIGYNTVCTDSSSVALGSGATTTAPNQIVLGTATETVKIPGQLDVSNNSLRITTTDSNCSLLINEEIGTTLNTTAGSLIISHGDRNGQSSILFPSTRNATDYAAIQYQETDPTDTGDPDNEKGILRLICENDATTNHEDQIRFNTGTSDRMTIGGSGNVGIGTTSPITTLEVVGDISASSINTSSFSGNPTFNGTVTAVSFNATSDIRLKENITNLDNSLDKICNIRGVNYNWKNDETKTKTAGVIAQEVLEQIPEAVIDSDSEKLSVNYNSIIAHLIESVKELKREIEELKVNK